MVRIRKMCRALRRSKMVAHNMSNREISYVKNLIAPYATWREFGELVSFARYISDDVKTWHGEGATNNAVAPPKNWDYDSTIQGGK